MVLWCCGVVVLLCCCVAVVVVVSDTTITRQVYINQPGHELVTRASSPKRRPKNAVKLRRKIHTIITGVNHVELEKYVQFSKCELRGAKLQPEASTGTLLHSNRMEKKRIRIRECHIVETCVKFVHSHQSTDAEHVSTVEPSIAPTKKVVSRRIQNSYSSATPRHPEQ